MRSSHHFTSEDEKLEEKLTSLWEEFVVEVADAVDHVALQTPLMMQTLDIKLQVYCTLFAVFIYHICEYINLYDSNDCGVNAH